MIHIYLSIFYPSSIYLSVYLSIYHLSTSSPYLSTFEYWGSMGFHPWPVLFLLSTLRVPYHYLLYINNPDSPSPDSSLGDVEPTSFPKFNLVLFWQKKKTQSEICI